MINLMPSSDCFAMAEMLLDEKQPRHEHIFWFQPLVALIITCIRRGHNRSADIAARVAAVVGPKHAPHILWLIDILSGPAIDAHPWDHVIEEDFVHLHGLPLELSPDLVIAT